MQNWMAKQNRSCYTTLHNISKLLHKNRKMFPKFKKLHRILYSTRHEATYAFCFCHYSSHIADGLIIFIWEQTQILSSEPLDWNSWYCSSIFIHSPSLLPKLRFRAPYLFRCILLQFLQHPKPQYHLLMLLMFTRRYEESPKKLNTLNSLNSAMACDCQYKNKYLMEQWISCLFL